MNAINPWQQGPRVFMRSLATRDFGSEISKALPDVIAACKAAGFDLIVVETSGIGQGDAAIVPLVDVPMYVMTPEFGAASQLEKIDMLDFAEFVAINKFDRKGASDALRDVAKQVQRNREAFTTPPEQMPVFGTMAARFNDDGVTALYQALQPRLVGLGLKLAEGTLPLVNVRHSTNQNPVVPAARTRYLAEISDTVRGYKIKARAQARLAREIQQLRAAAAMLEVGKPDRAQAAEAAIDLAMQREAIQDPSARKLLAQWPEMQKAYAGDEYVVKIRDKEIRTALTTKVAVGHHHPQGGTAAVRGPRRNPQMADAGQRTRQLPLHRRHLRLQARERRSDPHVCRRRRPVPHQPPLQAAQPRAWTPSACPPPLTRSRCTATTPTAAPTSTARSATPACRWPPWTT
jgi:methylmalonyl-CoA mutase